MKAGSWAGSNSAAPRSSTPSPAAIRRSSAWAGRRREKRLHFYAHFYGKLARYEGHWTFMPGMQLGARLGRSLAFGLVGFGGIGPEANSRPPFWGLAVDYALLEKGRFGLRLRTVAGFMYKNRENELAKLLSLVVEPGFGLSWALSHRTQPHHPAQPRFRRRHQRQLAPLLLGTGAGAMPAMTGL